MPLFRRVFIASGLVLAAVSQVLAEGSTFDLSPEQPGRLRAPRNAAAIARQPADFRFVSPGVFTVAITPGGPPLATYATDARTVVGSVPISRCWSLTAWA